MVLGVGTALVLGLVATAVAQVGEPTLCVNDDTARVGVNCIDPKAGLHVRSKGIWDPSLIVRRRLGQEGDLLRVQNEYGGPYDIFRIANNGRVRVGPVSWESDSYLHLKANAGENGQFIMEDTQQGVECVNLIEFLDRNHTRTGYVGDAHSADWDMYVNSDFGGITFSTGAGGRGNRPTARIDKDGQFVSGTSVRNPSAALEVNSNKGGVLFPRLTTAERNRIPKPSEGLVIWNRDTKHLEVFDGAQWDQASL
jgi:hypothetical protein